MHHRDHRDYRISASKAEELKRKRREWEIQQKLYREHDKRKQRKIEEYEEKRARMLALEKRANKSSRSSSPSRSRSRSSKTPTTSKSSARSVKHDSPSSSRKSIKDSDGKKINVTELKKIKIEFHRKIDDADDKLERDIVEPEAVTVIRREGEGVRPFSQREEFNSSDELRRVISLDNSRSAGASRSVRRHSRSHSPPRHSSRSPRCGSRRESLSRSRDRYDRRGHDHHERERSIEYRDRHHRSSRRLTPDRYCVERSRRSDSRERYRPSLSSRNGDERSREPGLPLPHPYYDQMAVPFYYGNFARPMMIDPMMTIRGPLPMIRGRMPPVMMGHPRPPFAPRFIPPEQFRANIPPNQRFGRMF